MYFVNQNDAAFESEIVRWFTLPADLNQLIKRPWTLLTHMFLHIGVWHIIGNMIWLWVFGYILQDLTGNKKIIPIYLYGAIAGAAAYILAFNTLAVFKAQVPVATALGASAGVMAVAVATTMVAPDYRLLPMLNGGIPLWVITILYLIIDFATIPESNAGGHIAHLGGALAGFLFIVFLRRGYDGSDWMNNFFQWVNDLFNPDKPKKGKHVREQIFYKAKTSPFKKTSNLTQQKIDEILDKISQKGYHHLTEEEKEMLKRASDEEL